MVRVIPGEDTRLVAIRTGAGGNVVERCFKPNQARGLLRLIVENSGPLAPVLIRDHITRHNTKTRAQPPLIRL